MIRCLLLGLLFVQATSLLSQIPGYLGIRNTVQAEYHIFPAINYTGRDSEVDNFLDGSGVISLGINQKGRFQYGYVLTRKHQLVIGFDYLRTGTTFTGYSPSSTIDGGVNTHEVLYRLTGIGGNVGVRKFNKKKAGLAPLGTYGGWGLYYNYLKGKELASIISFADFNPDQPAPDMGFRPQTQTFGAYFESGVNWIVADRLILGGGVKVNIPFQFKDIIDFGLNGYTQPDPLSEYADHNKTNFNRAAISRVAAHSFLNVYASVGVLLF